MTKRIGVLVSGRGSNLAAIIDAIAARKLPLVIAVVISDQADAYALKRATGAGIKTSVALRQNFSTRADFEAQITAQLRAAGAELVVLAGFMRLLSADFVAAWPNKIINIHPALLPSFPGLHAQKQAVEYGVKYAGCTVHFVDAGTDSGPIILQKVVPVLAQDDAETLAERILIEEHKALPEALALWAADRLRLEGRIVRIIEKGAQPNEN